jgi:CRP-like cAMP-binding protein
MLRQTELFRNLTSADLRDVECVMATATCKRGHVFRFESEPREVLYMLMDGLVQLSHIAQDGRRHPGGVLPSGTMFGEMRLLAQRLDPYSLECLDDCSLSAITAADLERLMALKPQLALNAIEILAVRLADTERRLELLAHRRVRQLVAALLLELAGDGDEVVGVSQQQIADTIGKARETVARTLAEFRSEALIETGHRRLLLKSREGIAVVASARAALLPVPPTGGGASSPLGRHGVSFGAESPGGTVEEAAPFQSGDHAVLETSSWISDSTAT